ncbi:MAG TPA: c-type cytochrome [Chitinophagaceae bacterium]|jgi:cytochrome c|nr:c-type cytochrome [Chitinophagaceae bacterium]
MKKLLIGFFVLAALTACNGGDSKEKDDKQAKTEDPSANPDYQKGLALVAKHKCMTCHAIDETITGPPYREVAKKYADSPDTIVAHLASKIINGGNGVWGEVFMTPNTGVTNEEAEAMVKYILLLKK